MPALRDETAWKPMASRTRSRRTLAAGASFPACDPTYHPTYGSASNYARRTALGIHFINR